MCCVFQLLEHWNHYDGIVKPDVTKGLLSSFTKTFSIKRGDKRAKAKLILQSLLPIWRGFCLEGTQSDQRAQEAIAQVDDVLQSIHQSFRGEWRLLKSDNNILKQVGLDFLFVQKFNVQRI